MIRRSPVVKSQFPEAEFGAIIVKGLSGSSDRIQMDRILAAELQQLKADHNEYDRKTAVKTEPFCHYVSYYKRYKKTYHVLGQLESVLLKDKTIPKIGVPVEAMFLSELKNLLLMGGHDLDKVEGQLTVHAAVEPVKYTSISGKEQSVAANDLYLADEKGVLSSIINGPDYQTRITENTNTALYFIYGVDGVTAQLINEQLTTLAEYLSQAVKGVEIQFVTVE